MKVGGKIGLGVKPRVALDFAHAQGRAPFACVFIISPGRAMRLREVTANSASRAVTSCGEAVGLPAVCAEKSGPQLIVDWRHRDYPECIGNGDPSVVVTRDVERVCAVI